MVIKSSYMDDVVSRTRVTTRMGFGSKVMP